jgi:predicted nucleic acid-binding Zn finger protein
VVLYFIMNDNSCNNKEFIYLLGFSPCTHINMYKVKKHGGNHRSEKIYSLKPANLWGY